MTLNSFLKWTTIGAILAALATPLIVAQSLFFPFIVGKALFFRVFVEIALAAWLLLIMRDSASRPKLSSVLWSFIAFAAVIGLADIFGMNAWKSFWSNFERMEGYITILHLLAYFIVAGSVLASDRLWKYFMQLSLAVSSIVSVYGLSQLFGKAVDGQGSARIDSLLGNASYLAIYVLFNIFFALMLMAREKGWGLRSLYAAIAVMEVVILYNTGTRGAGLGFLGGLFIAAALVAFFDKSEPRRRIMARSFLGAIVFLVIVFFGIRQTEFVQNSAILSRFASISLSDAKSQARYYLWPIAWTGVKEKPLLGWGQENFNYVFNKNYDPRLYGQEQWFDRAHNVMLDWLIAGGFIGLFAYLSLWGSALYLLWRKTTDLSFTEKALLTGLGAGYFVHNLFVFDNITSYSMFASVLAFIHVKSTRLAKPLGSDAEEADDGDMKVAGALVLVCLCVAIYFFNYRAYATGATLIDALRASGSTPVQVEQAIAAFSKAASYDTLGRSEVVERMIEAAQRINSSGASIDLRRQYYTLVNAAIQQQLKRAPGDARYELFAGSFYSLNGMPELAEQHMRKAQELSPDKQTILFSLGSILISENKVEEGLAAFKHAYELDETKTEVLQYYVVALITAGREAEAASLLKEKTGSADMTSNIFLQTYADLGEWGKVVTALKARIKADPSNMDDRKNLAAAYLQLGDKASAIAVIREMISLDPSFKATGEEYIRQIQGAGI